MQNKTQEQRQGSYHAAAQSTRRSKRHSERRSILMLALLLVALGFGNFIFAHSKKAEYVTLLSKSQGSSTIPLLARNRSLQTILNGYVILDKQSEYLRKVQARIDFYGFIDDGARAFFIIGGIMAMFAFVVDEK